MELHQVRYFVTLAKTLNFTRAAEQCSVTQPALTKAVQKLEHELGGELIHRERQLTQLTDLGKVVLPMLKSTLVAAEAVQTQAREYRSKSIAPLRIGLAPSISPDILMAPIAEIARVVPGLQIELIEELPERLVEMLLEGDIAAAIVGAPGALPDRIDHWRLYGERYVVVSAADRPIATWASVPLDALAEETWLHRVGCGAVARLNLALPSGCDSLKVGHSARKETHLQHMAAAGFGVMLAPEREPRLPSLAAIPIEGDPVAREVRLLVVAGRRYSPALDALVKIARLRDWSASSSADEPASTRRSFDAEVFADRP